MCAEYDVHKFKYCSQKKFLIKNKTVTKHGEIKSFYLVTVFEFVYVITELVFSCN